MTEGSLAIRQAAEKIIAIAAERVLVRYFVRAESAGANLSMRADLIGGWQRRLFTYTCTLQVTSGGVLKDEIDYSVVNDNLPGHLCGNQFADWLVHGLFDPWKAPVDFVGLVRVGKGQARLFPAHHQDFALLSGYALASINHLHGTLARPDPGAADLVYEAVQKRYRRFLANAQTASLAERLGTAWVDQD